MTATRALDDRAAPIRGVTVTTVMTNPTLAIRAARKPRAESDQEGHPECDASQRDGAEQDDKGGGHGTSSLAGLSSKRAYWFTLQLPTGWADARINRVIICLGSRGSGKMDQVLLRSILALLFASGVPQFTLHDTKGGAHTSAEWAQSKAAVVFFMTIDCPVGNSYVPEMNRIHDAYASRGVVVWAVQADPHIPEAAVAKYATDYHYSFPLLLDPTQTLVQQAGATITPQAAVFSPEGKLMYLGRIDNRVEDFGMSRPKATVPDLRNAIDAVLAGRPVSPDRTKSVGCAIPRKDYRK